MGGKRGCQDAAQDSESHGSLGRRPRQAQDLLSPGKSDLQPPFPGAQRKPGASGKEVSSLGNGTVKARPGSAGGLGPPATFPILSSPVSPTCHPVTSPPPFAHSEGNLRNQLTHRATNPKQWWSNGSITSTVTGDGFRTMEAVFWDIPPAASPVSTLLGLCLEPGLVSRENTTARTRALAAI